MTSPGSQAVHGWSSGLRYGGLGFALSFMALPLYVLLPEHYALKHGVPLATLGVILLATRLLDGLLDPLIGQWVDRLFSGSYNRVLAVACAASVLMASGFIALFFAPLKGLSLLVWLSIALLASYAAFSTLTVIHQSWGARLGGDPEQRAKVVAWRETFGITGVLMASVLPSQYGLSVTSGVLVAALFAGLLLLRKAPRGASEPALSRSTISWLQPWQNPSFRNLLFTFTCNGIASALPATLVLFFIRDVLLAEKFQALFLGSYFAFAALSMPVWVRLIRRFGLVAVWLAGMLLSVLAFAGALSLGQGDVAGFLIVCAASGIGLGADLTVPAALLAGVVQKSGQSGRAEGVYFGWWSSASKFNLGLAAGIALPLLTWAGYAPGMRDEAALDALKLAYVFVPCALKLAAAAMLWRWRNSSRNRE